MYPTPASAQALTVGGVCYYASLWTLTRTDGTVLRFTDHDQPLVYAGDTYTPSGGFDASAREKKVGIDPANLDIKGTLTAEAITAEDLMAGAYRNARLVETVVDWRYPYRSPFRRDEYQINETTFDGEEWTAQVDTFLIVLKPKKGRRFLRTCQWELGDARCGVNLASFTATGEVTALLETNRVFETDLAGAVADGYWQEGKVTWTSGANNGEVMEVLDSLFANGTLYLLMPTTRPIQVGDTFSLTPGCNHISGVVLEGEDPATVPEGHCISRYNNILRFGGFPFMRGTDALLETPESTA